MQYDVTIQDGQVLVTVNGSLNVKVADELSGDLHELIDRGERHFVVDLGKTEYIDSAGLGVFVETRERLDDVNGSIKVVNLTGYCREAFQAVRMIEDYCEEGA